MLKSGSKGATWNIVLDLLAIALIFFTASRTWDLLIDILGQDQAVFCVFALAALDGGLIGWAYFHMHAARGDTQRAISLLMIIVCATGVTIAFIGDMFLRAGRRGMVRGMDENTTTIVIILLGAVIVANIIAFISVKVADPGTAMLAEEQKADDLLHAKRIAAIKNRAESVADELAPEAADAWEKSTKSSGRADIQQKYGSKLPDANRNGAPDLTEALDAGNKTEISRQLAAAMTALGEDEFNNLVKSLLGASAPAASPATTTYASDAPVVIRPNGQSRTPKA